MKIVIEGHLSQQPYFIVVFSLICLFNLDRTSWHSRESLSHASCCVVSWWG